MTIYYQDNYVYVRERRSDRFYIGMCYEDRTWHSTGMQFTLPWGVTSIEIDCEIDWLMPMESIREKIISHLPIELYL